MAIKTENTGNEIRFKIFHCKTFVEKDGISRFMLPYKSGQSCSF